MYQTFTNHLAPNEVIEILRSFSESNGGLLDSKPSGGMVPITEAPIETAMQERIEAFGDCVFITSTYDSAHPRGCQHAYLFALPCGDGKWVTHEWRPFVS